MFQEDDKTGKSAANPIIPRGQDACRRAGRMPVAARAGCLSPRGQDARRRQAYHVALRIQGVHDGGDSYPTMRDG
ncbi:hypothetical protein E0H39_15680 [Rhizobium leguminosarum bv. viciae]|nr:hypothetical protein [Rhizobium leguminosarum bv. viciae]TBY63153.1 hypothetical protein E0H39_15680 [Rhizobium leguminosarum bv. viciae]TBY98922.1 hypothetical protein E0H49_19480 [Rhizobium leguminosarum bv. viciae]TBZ38840.1 hypothetical protein E0H47_19360 [Rhizobium leguminosarum bv. viciae]TBZ49938.1 hypothetical protein E0H42_21640 [Rhizobium leguminosarum bv. viciae]